MASTAFGQAMPEPSHAIQFRDYAENAAPISEKSPLTPNVYQNNELYQTEVQAQIYSSRMINSTVDILNQRIQMADQGITQSNDLPIEYNNNAIELSVYPNPTDNQLTLSSYFPESQAISIRIYDSRGSLVEEVLKNFTVQGLFSHELNTSSYAAGTYSVIMQSGEYTTQESVIITK